MLKTIFVSLFLVQLCRSQRKAIAFAPAQGVKLFEIECNQGHDIKISLNPTVKSSMYPGNTNVLYYMVNSNQSKIANCEQSSGGDFQATVKLGQCSSKVETVVGSSNNRTLVVEYSMMVSATAKQGEVFISAQKQPVYKLECKYDLGPIVNDKEKKLKLSTTALTKDEKVVNKINFSMWDKNYANVTRQTGRQAVFVDEMLYFKIKYQEDFNFTYNLQIEDCWLSENGTKEDYRIIKDGCPTTKSETSVTMTHVGKEIRLAYKSFIFTKHHSDTTVYYNRVYLMCSTSICIPRQGTCSIAPFCSNASGRYRAKREISNEDKKEEQKQTESFQALTVQIPQVSYGPFTILPRCDSSVEHCYCSSKQRSKSHCEQLCLLDANYQPKCECKHGFQLDTDGTSCTKNHHQTSDLAITNNKVATSPIFRPTSLINTESAATVNNNVLMTIVFIACNVLMNVAGTAALWKLYKQRRYQVTTTTSPRFQTSDSCVKQKVTYGIQEFEVVAPEIRATI